MPAPWFAPGLAWAYSNTNYVLLGMIVERVSGQPFATLLQQRLLDPLELSGTGVLLGEGRAVPDGTVLGICLRHLRRHVRQRRTTCCAGAMRCTAAGSWRRRAWRHMLDFQRRHRLWHGRRAHQGRRRDRLRALGPAARLHLADGPPAATSDLDAGGDGHDHPSSTRRTVLAYRAPGKPSILDLAERAAEAKAAA